jgi:SpoVK/Ycf46/Vps4 family AAA+-type ATPase
MSVNAVDIISAVVGDSEAALAAVFKRAREMAPTVLVFDCFEAIAAVRRTGKGASSVDHARDRLFSVLLTELDGMQSSSGAIKRSGGDGDDQQAKPIILVANTSFESSLDPAVLRPGRLDLRVAMTTPTPQDIATLLNGFIQKQAGASFSALSVDAWAERMDGLSYGDITAMWQEAGMHCLRRRTAGLQASDIDSSSLFVDDCDMEKSFNQFSQAIAVLDDI